MSDFSSTAAFSDLVGRIYDCAVDPGQWPDTLASLHRVLGFSTASLTLLAIPEGRMLLQVASGIPPEWLERARDYASDVIDLWGGADVAHRFPLDRAAVVSRVNPAALRPETMNRYAREWALPQGLVDSMALILARDTTVIGTIGLGRHIDDGPIGEAEMAHAELLLPHLQRAAAISRLLEARNAATTAFDAVIDALTTPVFLLARDSAILYANDAARALLATGDSLTGRHNILSSTQPEIAKSLATAVARCAREDLAREGVRSRGARDVEPIGVAIRSRAGAHALHILPLRSGTIRQGLVPGAVAAVFLTRPAVPTSDAAATAAAVFGLTPAETRVFERIAAGLTRAEAAQAIGIAPSTVQTHLLRVFAKVGVRRQSDLVQLAASLASPIARAPVENAPRRQTRSA